MQTNDTTSGQKIILKCKPLSALSAPQSSNLSQKATSSRRSNRIASRTNDENEMEGNVQINRNGVQSSSSDDNVIVRKRKTTSERQSQNRIQNSSDDEQDDDFVPKTVKKRSPKKRRSQSNVQTDAADAISEPKRKSPVKRRKQLLTIKCNKITDYFGKSTVTTTASDAATNHIEGTVGNARANARADRSNFNDRAKLLGLIMATNCAFSTYRTDSSFEPM